MYKTLEKRAERANARALPSSPSARNYTILGLVIWFASSLSAGWFGLFVQSGPPQAYFGIFIALPFMLAAMLYLLSDQFRAYTHSISLSLIVGAHVWRFVGIGFIIAYLLGDLPPEFAIPEGLGDIIAAMFAIPLARALYRGRRVRNGFVLWNVFGLFDLASALTMGMLYSEGPLGILRTGVSTGLMTTFPVNVIPTFFVPLFIMLHVLALLRRHEVGSIERLVR